MKKTLLLSTAIIITACSVQQSQDAQRAQTEMIGKTKEEVLQCMGTPNKEFKTGKTEAWSYKSGGSVSIDGYSNHASLGHALFSANASSRQCNVDVLFKKGKVTSLNYTGASGGLLTPHQECYFVVKNCLKKQSDVNK